MPSFQVLLTQPRWGCIYGGCVGDNTLRPVDAFAVGLGPGQARSPLEVAVSVQKHAFSFFFWPVNSSIFKRLGPEFSKVPWEGAHGEGGTVIE